MGKLQTLLKYIKQGYDYEFDWDQTTGIVYLIVENPDYQNPWGDPNCVVELVEKIG